MSTTVNTSSFDNAPCMFIYAGESIASFMQIQRALSPTGKNSVLEAFEKLGTVQTLDVFLNGMYCINMNAIDKWEKQYEIYEEEDINWVEEMHLCFVCPSIKYPDIGPQRGRSDGVYKHELFQLSENVFLLHQRMSPRSFSQPHNVGVFVTGLTIDEKPVTIAYGASKNSDIPICSEFLLSNKLARKCGIVKMYANSRNEWTNYFRKEEDELVNIKDGDYDWISTKQEFLNFLEIKSLAQKTERLIVHSICCNHHFHRYPQEWNVDKPQPQQEPTNKQTKKT